MKLEVIKSVKTANGRIWRAGLIFSEQAGDVLPPELIKVFDQGDGLVRMSPEAERRKPEPPKPPVDRITFKTKSEVKTAKKNDLMAYLADSGVLFSEEETREKLIEKALEVFDVSEVAGAENDAI